MNKFLLLFGCRVFQLGNRVSQLGLAITDKYMKRHLAALEL